MAIGKSQRPNPWGSVPPRAPGKTEQQTEQPKELAALPSDTERKSNLSRRNLIFGSLAAGLSGMAWWLFSRWPSRNDRSVSTSLAGGSGTSERHIDVRQMMNYVALLSQVDWEGRMTGSRGEAKAGEYIARMWSKWGLQPKGEAGTFFQTFPVPAFSLATVNGRMRVVPGGTGGGSADNLIGFLPGRDLALRHEVVVVSAHYDHLGKSGDDIYPGANDNASGVAVLLELARLTVQARPRRSVAFIAFSGEEAGLLGSKYFVQNPLVPLNNIVALVNLDTVGNGEAADFIYWSADQLPWQATIEEAARHVGIRVAHQSPGSHSSDHQPFVGQGVPAITVLSSSWLDDNHTPRDVAANIKPDKLQKIAEWSWRMVCTLADAPGK